MAKIRISNIVDVKVVKSSNGMYTAKASCDLGYYEATAHTSLEAVEMIARSMNEGGDYAAEVIAS
jgi:hypothetical protein